MERTLIILKPDAVQRRLAGEIIHRFERKGLRIEEMTPVQRRAAHDLLRSALSSRGYLKAHLRRTVEEYRARRDALVEVLSSGLPKSVQWTPPSHGVVLWLLLPSWMDPAQVLREAEREGVLVTPGVLYSASGHNRRGLRLTYCGESTDRIAEGGRRLCRAIQRVMQRSNADSSPTTTSTIGVV